MAKPGTLIIFEGIDGSGKSTQAKLLMKRLEGEGRETAFLDFPQYGKKSAGLVEEYLAGAYGGSAEVGPYQASIFYACDRYDASFTIRTWLAEGRVVVADRYVGSNIGHQGGKIRDAKKREDFFRWLYELEYDIFGIPKPNRSFFLNVPPGIAKKLCENPERRKTKKNDIHEKDISHLEHAHASYENAVRLFPEDFVTIECTEEGVLLSPENVHEKVWREVSKIL